MGQELACRVRYDAKTLTGTAYLETDYLLFRGEQRIEIPFRQITSIEADEGTLRLEFDGAEAAFELGAAAAKWAEKIMNPPTRLNKLGVKPGSAVALTGEFDNDFLEDLRMGEARIVDGPSRADLLFLAAPDRAALKPIPKLIARLAPRGVLWVVYPKGVSAIREIEVIEAGRAAGLKDTKVASFSKERTALRFSIPAGAQR